MYTELKNWHFDLFQYNEHYELSMYETPDITETGSLTLGSIEHIFRKQNDLFAIVVHIFMFEIHKYFRYNNNTGFFIKQQISVPTQLIGRRGCGYAKSSNDNYLFICGGYTENNISKNKLNPAWFSTCYSDIYVLDLTKMKIYQSKVKLPKNMNGEIQAICMPCHKIDDLIINGFIREACTNNNNNKIHFPRYLRKIISTNYYYNDYLHVIQVGLRNEKCHHWKININDVII